MAMTGAGRHARGVACALALACWACSSPAPSGPGAAAPQETESPTPAPAPPTPTPDPLAGARLETASAAPGGRIVIGGVPTSGLAITFTTASGSVGPAAYEASGSDRVSVIVPIAADGPDFKGSASVVVAQGPAKGADLPLQLEPLPRAPQAGTAGRSTEALLEFAAPTAAERSALLAGFGSLGEGDRPAALAHKLILASANPNSLKAFVGGAAADLGGKKAAEGTLDRIFHASGFAAALARAGGILAEGPAPASASMLAAPDLRAYFAQYGARRRVTEEELAKLDAAAAQALALIAGLKDVGQPLGAAFAASYAMARLAHVAKTGSLPVTAAIDDVAFGPLQLDTRVSRWLTVERVIVSSRTEGVDADFGGSLSRLIGILPGDTPKTMGAKAVEYLGADLKGVLSSSDGDLAGEVAGRAASTRFKLQIAGRAFGSADMLEYAELVSDNPAVLAAPPGQNILEAKLSGSASFSVRVAIPLNATQTAAPSKGPFPVTVIQRPPAAEPSGTETSTLTDTKVSSREPVVKLRTASATDYGEIVTLRVNDERMGTFRLATRDSFQRVALPLKPGINTLRVVVESAGTNVGNVYVKLDLYDVLPGSQAIQRTKALRASPPEKAFDQMTITVVEGS